MNRQEREVRQILLNEERDTLESLYEEYQMVTDQLEYLTKELKLSLNNPKVVYQLELQAELEARISEIVDSIDEIQNEKTDSFLVKCAMLGFIGALYSFYHQGVDEDVPVETKIDSDFRDRYAYHKAQLVSEVKSEISRGVASGLTISRIVDNIKSRVNVAFNKVATVVRTEGSSTFEQNNFLAAEQIGEKYEVYKEWSSMMDTKVRPDHQTLEGQVVPLEEPFVLHSEDGNTYYAMYPHNFGVAKEDINCRCTVVNRVDVDESEVFEEYKDYYDFEQDLLAYGF